MRLAAVSCTDHAPCFRYFGIGFLLCFIQQNELKTRTAFALFSSWERSSWHSTTMPVGIWVMRTAELYLVDMLAAGTAGTVVIDAHIIHVEVDFHIFGFRQYGYGRCRSMKCGRRLSRQAIRCTRCTPDSYLSLPYTPDPSTEKMTSLKPPNSGALELIMLASSWLFFNIFHIHAE